MINKEVNNDVEVVLKNVDTVKCDGGEGDLGHPVVYFKMINEAEIICNYCNKKFVRKAN